jgi:phosphohistidine phosphatase SixA
MTLYLVQHGEARPGNEDSERSLTDHGVQTVSRTAAWAA